MKAAIITGASSGIGRELAKLFAEHDYSLLLVARRAHLLETLKAEIESQHKKLKIVLLSIDMSLADSPQKIYDCALGEFGTISALVNNAGVGSNGEFAKTSLEDQLKMIQLNVNSLVALTHLCIEPMKEAGGQSYILASSPESVGEFRLS